MLSPTLLHPSLGKRKWRKSRGSIGVPSVQRRPFPNFRPSLSAKIPAIPADSMRRVKTQEWLVEMQNQPLPLFDLDSLPSAPTSEITAA